MKYDHFKFINVEELPIHLGSKYQTEALKSV